MKETLKETIAREYALLIAERQIKKQNRQLAVMKRRLHKASLIQPHRRPAKGESHLVALVAALQKHVILPHRRLIEEAMKFGARTSCKNPEWPIHAILCRNPKIFARPARAHWMLAKGWQKAYEAKVA